MKEINRVFVVGNGPINSNIGKEIDQSGIVIRMNNFRIGNFERKIGTKTTIYAVWPSRALQNYFRSDADLKNESILEVWMVRPRSWCESLDEYNQFKEKFPHVTIYHLEDRTWESACRHFRTPHLLTNESSLINNFMNSRLYTSQIGPSTGYTVLLMCLDRFRDRETHVVGLNSKPEKGWYWGRNQNPSPRHPWAAEKLGIGALAERQKILLRK